MFKGIHDRYSYLNSPLRNAAVTIPPPIIVTSHIHKQILFHRIDASLCAGHWFRVRSMPCRTLENRIDGLVITFTDVTVSKTLEAELRKAQAALEIRVGEQQVELERSEGRFPAEEKRVLVAKQKCTGPPRPKKGESP